MVSKATRIWDNYWKSGQLQSCITDPGVEKQQEINQFWRDIYANFHDDTVFLDIGTGNGLLPSLAVAYANDQDYAWEIHGVDLADINPVRDVPNQRELLEQINFHGRIAAEQLPFEDNYFDVVTSQYAIEYGDMKASIPEIARVMRTGGRFHAVLHIKDSIVIKQNNAMIAEVVFLLKSDIFQRSKNLLTQYWKLNATAREWRAEKELKTLADDYIKNIKQLGQSFPSGIILRIIPEIQQGLFDTLKHCSVCPLDQNLQIIDRAVMSLGEQKIILTNLVDSALDKYRLDQLMEDISTVGFEAITRKKFYNGTEKNLIGISIAAQKK